MLSKFFSFLDQNRFHQFLGQDVEIVKVNKLIRGSSKDIKP